jgi:hypothetical protein
MKAGDLLYHCSCFCGSLKFAWNLALAVLAETNKAVLGNLSARHRLQPHPRTMLEQVFWTHITRQAHLDFRSLTWSGSILRMALGG